MYDFPHTHIEEPSKVTHTLRLVFKNIPHRVIHQIQSFIINHIIPKEICGNKKSLFS